MKHEFEIPMYVLTSSHDFGLQTFNKSNRKWISSMYFGDNTYVRTMILSPPLLLFSIFFPNLPTHNANEFQYTYILMLMDQKLKNSGGKLVP